MKQTLLKILKVFLIITGVALGLLFICGMVLILGWPWWMGIFLLIGFVGLGIGFLFFRKIWLRNKEQRFVQQIIEQDNSSRNKLADQEKSLSQELQAKWKEAITTLKQSHLKKHGNPLYVLPWYLVIGESGSGKTTALQSARLSSPFADVQRTSGISGTRNCDWWFFEEAIILDTAGRYTIQIDEERDKEEWQRFLNLLVKYKKKEPLNGLIITIASDKLLKGTADTIEEEATSIRRRLDELMRVLGIKVPVYILITKCDLILGMTQFCDQLPEETLNQPMGFLNQDLNKDITHFFDKAFETVSERLKDLQLLLLHNPEQAVDSRFLVFPGEVEGIKENLNTFLTKIFQQNPYQETPLLRGLFFSSGRQEGTPFSHFLEGLGLISEKEVLPGTNKGLFLHDFFAKILPKEKQLFAPTQRSLEWRQLTRSLGITSWIALFVALCGLLSFSFVMNMKTLRGVSDKFSKPRARREEIIDSFGSKIGPLELFRQSVLKVEKSNKNWWVPSFGLNESKKVEISLKKKYCEKVQSRLLARLDQKIEKNLSQQVNFLPDDTFAMHHIEHLVRRIHLIYNRLDSQDFDTLKGRPQPSYNFVSDENISPDMKDTINTLYLYYLIWSREPGPLKVESRDLQDKLVQILTAKREDLNWLITWANNFLPPITLQDFWGGNELEEGPLIAASYTSKGKDHIESFLKDIESSLPDPMVISIQKENFFNYYQKAYLQSWYAFGDNFPQGIKKLQTKEEKKRIALKISQTEGPYQNLIKKMTEELGPFSENEKAPAWLNRIYQFSKLKSLAEIKDAAAKNKGLVNKVANKGKNLISNLERRADRVSAGFSFEVQQKASLVYHEYQSALAEMTPSLNSKNLSYQTACQVFQEEQATGQSAIYKAQRALMNLKAHLGNTDPAGEMAWQLLANPLYTLWEYILAESGDYLQEEWEEKVLAEVQNISGWKDLQQLIIGPGGFVKMYLNASAKPFLRKSQRKGYYAKEILGHQLPFNDTFIFFLNKGAKAEKAVKDNFSVTIKGLPTEANSSARLRPHATHLELYCGDEVQKLVNLNYPISKTFSWSPGNCSKVVFQIDVAELSCKKTYTGDFAFCNFLEDFQDGARTFYANEFPAQKIMLNRYGIKYIKARYHFNGHRPVLLLSKNVPTRVPQKIILDF